MAPVREVLHASGALSHKRPRKAGWQRLRQGAGGQPAVALRPVSTADFEVALAAIKPPAISACAAASMGVGLPAEQEQGHVPAAADPTSR